MNRAADLVLADLREEFRRTDWFGRIGVPPEAEDRRLVKDYFMKLGRPRMVAVWLHDLGAAEAVLQREEIDAPWLEAEREAGEALTRAAAAALGEIKAAEAVNRATLAASDAAMAAARTIFARKNSDDEALLRVAAGAAGRAGGEYALVLLGGADPETHPFAAKLRLYAAGRWPLVAIDDQLALL